LDILTKISVIVLVVLILLAVPVFINASLHGPKFKEDYEREQATSRLYQQAAEDARLNLQRAVQELQSARTRADQIAARRDEQIRQLKAELEQERLKGTQLGAKLTTISSEIVEINASLRQYIERAKQFSDRIAEQQQTIDQLTDENMALSRELNQQKAAYERVQQVTRNLREQISEYKETIQDMGRQMEALRGGAAPSAVAGVPERARPRPEVEGEPAVSGMITAVMPDKNLASINIGSANGVKKGMRMIISRGAQLVGYLRVEDVYTSQAAGIIVEKQMTPQQGDRVATRSRVLE